MATRQIKKFSQLAGRALKIDTIIPKVDQDQINITATTTTPDNIFNLIRY